MKSKHFLASGELVAVDAQGRYYVLAEELLGDQPELAVHTVLARYSSSGELQDVADIPIDAVVFLPNRYVAVTPKGKAYFLEPTDREVRILRLRFEKRTSISAEGERSAIIGASRAAAPAADGEFEGMVRDLYADDAPPTTRGAISRDRILENANRYLRLSWSLKPQNYEQEGAPEKCSPPAGLWKRPPRLDGKVNKEIQALPYRWGGYDSLQGFKDKLKKGYLAGDVCTCRKSEYGYCISKKSTGVDCSGFVSRVLEEKYHTTSRLHKVADRLPSLHDLRPGDFLNRAGRHVRLFVGFAEDGPFALKTIESAVKCGGICEASYRVSQLNGYVPMRYKYVED